jgi:hypothetical protein
VIHSFIITFFLVGTMAMAQFQLDLKVHCNSFHALQRVRALSQKELAPNPLKLLRKKCSGSQRHKGQSNAQKRTKLIKPDWWK